MRSFPFNILLSEGGILYLIHGIISAIKYYKKGYRYIYSSYSPITDHYIAFCIKCIYKNSFWIADYRDPPYIKKENTFIFSRFQKYLIHKLIARADIILTVSNGLKTIYFDEHNDNVIVLRNGISDIILKKNTEINKSNKFKITYTGNIYYNKSNPNLLFKAITNLIKKDVIKKEYLDLVYAGNSGNLWQKICNENNLGQCVTQKGYVSVNESIQLQNESHLNLLLSWCTTAQKGILTGKFYEYLKARKPIILLINGEKDNEFEKIMNGLTAGITCYNNDIEQIEEFITEKYTEWKNTGNVESTINETELIKYTWDYQFNEFYNKFI